MRFWEDLETRRMMTTTWSGPVVNPAQFGAKYDGKTNDSAAIQAAINSLPASGGTVLISGVSALAGTGIHITGRNNVRLTAAAAGDGFILTGTFNTSWTQGITSLGYSAVAVKDSSNCSIDALTINGGGKAAPLIGFVEDSYVTCANNMLNNVGSANGAVVATGNSHNTYTGNTIKNTAAGTRGLWIGNCHASEVEQNPTISFNTISYCGATGIGTQSSGPLIMNNNVQFCQGAA